MFYHAVHLLSHSSALEGGVLGLHPAQFCALAGEKDAGVVCTCAARVLSCPEPTIVGTTKGLKVDLPELGNKASVKAWLMSHPNNSYLVCCVCYVFVLLQLTCPPLRDCAVAEVHARLHGGCTDTDVCPFACGMRRGSCFCLCIWVCRPSC